MIQTSNSSWKLVFLKEGKLMLEGKQSEPELKFSISCETGKHSKKKFDRSIAFVRNIDYIF